MKNAAPKFIGTIACGLLAGGFIYGLLNLVPTFYEVPMDVHLKFRVQLMSHNSITMQLLMGISIITPLWYAFINTKAKRVMYLSILSSVMALTSLLVTRFGNVPINILMRTWAETQPPQNWLDLLHQWDTFNLLRCVAGFASFLLFITATHLQSYSRLVIRGQ